MMHARLFEVMAAFVIGRAVYEHARACLLLCLDGFYDSVAHIMIHERVKCLALDQGVA